MCGRLAIHYTSEQLSTLFGIIIEEDIIARYNIGYSEQVPVIVHDGLSKSFAVMEWGLIPSWSNKVNNEKKLTHARSETILEKPSFRESVRKRRCIIPASSFFDWENKGTHKQPWNISVPEQSVLYIAGIWDRWSHPVSGNVRHTVAVITVNPNEELTFIHDRMPVLLKKEEMERWLNPETLLDDALDMLRTYTGTMKLIPVSRDVNSVKNDGEHLIKQIDVSAPKISLFD